MENINKIYGNLTNNEILRGPILVYRQMSAEELNKFVNGEKILPNTDHDFSEVSSADVNSIYFSPEQLEYVDDDQHNPSELGLANNGRKISDFGERRNIWLCGGLYAKSVIVEFLTTKIPKVTAGNYNNKHIKEYVYEEYSSEQFQIQRIYSIDSGEVVFNVNGYTDGESRNTALKDQTD